MNRGTPNINLKYSWHSKSANAESHFSRSQTDGTTPFHIRDFSILGFWHPLRGVKITPEPRGKVHIHNYIHTYINAYYNIKIFGLVPSSWH